MVVAVERTTPWTPTRYGLSLPSLADLIRLMAGSFTNYSTTKIGDLVMSKTAYAGETTLYAALYTAAIDDTFNGATANEFTYTSYARMSLTNNATNFAAGTGTTAYTKTFPSDAAHNWPASTGGSTGPATYLGILNGNAGTSGDKGIMWCGVTPVTINSGDTPQLAQNGVTVVLD